MKTKPIIILLLIILNMSSATLPADSFFDKTPHTNFFDYFSWPWNHPTEDDDDDDDDDDDEDDDDDDDDDDVVQHINPFTQDKLENLKSRLQERIVGQNRAIDAIVSAFDTYTLGLHDSDKPIASLLFMGSSGTGKTHLATELAKLLLTDEHLFIRLNMSEYGNNNSDVARLIGVPPGWTGWELGGQFTEQLRKSPYGIILLDDLDRAGPRVIEFFKNAISTGKVTDAIGNEFDCRNYVFIATSNLEAQRFITAHTLGKNDNEIFKDVQPSYSLALTGLFQYLQPIIFNVLTEENIHQIIRILVSKYTDEVKSRLKVDLVIDESVLSALDQIKFPVTFGASKAQQIIKQKLSSAVEQAFKEKYLRPSDQAMISIHDHQLIIQKLGDSNFWSCPWKDDENEERCPYKLEKLLTLEEELNQRVLGQPDPIRVTVAALLRYAAGLKSGKGPIASLLYLGPTGVGKTQLAKEIAQSILGNEKHLIRLDMSEYSEEYAITRLIGAPPGYKDHDAGGQLTEALKQNPYAVVLLDEIEKAHPKILKAFLQVFDEGHLTDAKGILVDCRNALFILTTNLGSQTILKMHRTGNYTPQEILSTIQPDVMKTISPELYNRLEAVAFMGLSDDVLEHLIHNMLEGVQEELLDKQNIKVNFDITVVDFLKQNGFDYELGARPMKRLIQNAIVTLIAVKIIQGEVIPEDEIHLTFMDNELLIFVVNRIK